MPSVEQFSADVGSIPKWVFATHPAEQIADLMRTADQSIWPCRTFQVQKRRNPLRLQVITVSRLTMAERQSQQAVAEKPKIESRLESASVVSPLSAEGYRSDARPPPQEARSLREVPHTAAVSVVTSKCRGRGSRRVLQFFHDLATSSTASSFKVEVNAANMLFQMCRPPGSVHRRGDFPMRQCSRRTHLRAQIPRRLHVVPHCISAA
jgi:hypothetical protein